MQSDLSAIIFGDKEDPRCRLESIFGGRSTSAGPPPAAREWAKNVLDAAGLDPAKSPIEAIKCLRMAHPRLTLGTAKYLMHDATQR